MSFRGELVYRAYPKKRQGGTIPAARKEDDLVMKRQTAWNGFYKAVREAKRCEVVAKAEGHSCSVRDAWKAADMRAVRYARVLVQEYGWSDVHTAQYYRM